MFNKAINEFINIEFIINKLKLGLEWQFIDNFEQILNINGLLDQTNLQLWYKFLSSQLQFISAYPEKFYNKLLINLQKV